MPTEAQKEGLGQFADMGFTLERQDDDVIELHHDGEFVARFSQKGATTKSICQSCLDHITEKHGQHIDLE